jgi:hypothetical protein
MCTPSVLKYKTLWNSRTNFLPFTKFPGFLKCPRVATDQAFSLLYRPWCLRPIHRPHGSLLVAPGGFPPPPTTPVPKAPLLLVTGWSNLQRGMRQQHWCENVAFWCSSDGGACGGTGPDFNLRATTTPLPASQKRWAEAKWERSSTAPYTRGAGDANHQRQALCHISVGNLVRVKWAPRPPVSHHFWFLVWARPKSWDLMFDFASGVCYQPAHQ